MKITLTLVAGLSLATGAQAVIVNLTDVTIAGNAPDILTNTSNVDFHGGFINGALFRDPSVDGSAGSGTFRDLYRLSPPQGKGNEVESGYNRPGIMDTDIPNGFDYELRMGDLVLDASGSSYIFVVDINENNSATDRFLSLDDLKIWVGGTTDPAVLPETLNDMMSTLGVPVYDMNPAGQQNFALLDATLSTGSGGGDVFVFVPKSYFPQNADPNSFVYIYTSMGSYTGAPGFGAGATQEQVSIPGKSITGGGIQPGVQVVPVPEPTAISLLGLAGLLGLVRRRR
ncbi:PEP-CTERM sorting domain-containing protein [Luteolibacter marinus]|uniref:PEP-CTERM sorting domain-containing protein n=1 Tax=Luteolibacter marinus TaxID=2776705 RepID=UPI001866B234|nr:PEP-CTERM sorting domain-containing protein [Luteolibacter marinus]